MEKEINEITFGAKDSELYKFEYTIPDGYEARIEDGKVIVKKKESEDEMIRKMLIEQMERWKKCAEDNNVEQDVKDASAAIAYLEKQKEAQPGDEDRYMEGYMNGMNDALKEQKPAEWSQGDKNALVLFHELISFGYTERFCDAQTAEDMRRWLNERLKSTRPQPHWKPSEEQMEALDEYIWALEPMKSKGPAVISLYEDLKKLM